MASVLLAAPPQPTPDARPACRAEVAGNIMKTEIQFSDGTTVTAPWRILRTEHQDPGSPDAPRTVAVVLDHVIEGGSVGNHPVVIAFDRPVLTTFAGATDDEIMYHAAQSWCTTVIQSRMAGNRSYTPAPHQRLRITARALPSLWRTAA